MYYQLPFSLYHTTLSMRRIDGISIHSNQHAQSATPVAPFQPLYIWLPENARSMQSLFRTFP